MSDLHDGDAVGERGDLSASDERRRVHLASWDARFWAWLIDVIVVGAVVSAIIAVLNVAWSFSFGIFGTEFPLGITGFNGLGFFIYWTVLEGHGGQSAGKMILGIAVADKHGDRPDYVAAGIQAFGKAFLLPLDCLIGWLAFSGTGLRLFNRLSDTIVVKHDRDWQPDDVEYVYPDD